MSAAVRWTGRLSGLGPDDLRILLSRGQADSGERDLRAQVASLIADVRSRGDAALRELARRFDRVTLESLEVPREVVRAALDRQPPALRRAMERSARNVARVHGALRPQPSRVEVEPGIVVERRPDPLARVGVYAPGGRAAYPSSVLMGAVPARIAGVREIVLCSPPGPGGLPSAAVLAAAAVAEVDRVFALGGAGAIAALAYGTESVPGVDRIVGPGNAWVAEAKCQIASRVPIDSPAGPSELLVLLDATSDVEAVARELLAQAEHDPEAAVVAVALDDRTAARLLDRVATLAPTAERADVIGPALASRGAVLGAGSVDEAVAFAERWAPEHLMLALEGAAELARRIRNAGTVFVGTSSSGAFGDYLTGANHVLPTAGAARAWSGLSTLDFVRWTTVQTVSRTGAASLAVDTEVFATAEGLHAHAAAARAWGTR
ncbi:MAG: histidinol dehydrogenase [Myxococcaceae bacterium]|nr:MAG: histidinol dehydrogenase [Myxococcaceae bacterium]